MPTKKSPALIRAEVKLKKLLNEIKITEKRIKTLVAKDEKAANAAKKAKPLNKKIASAPKKAIKKTVAKKKYVAKPSAIKAKAEPKKKATIKKKSTATKKSTAVKKTAKKKPSKK
jgi:NADH:ubiquinone oxidoreductase subunit D